MKPLRLKLHWKHVEKIKDIVASERPHIAKRANILIGLHNGYTSSQLSKLLNVDVKTVTNVGNKYNAKGLEEALFDKPRPGRPIKIDAKGKNRIIAMVCSKPPDGFHRWTLDLIVEKTLERKLIDCSISREQVRIILNEHDLKPWQEKMWCIGELNQEYIDRMEDVLDLYEKKVDPKYPVVCVDEKPVQLLDDKKKQSYQRRMAIEKKLIMNIKETGS